MDFRPVYGTLNESQLLRAHQIQEGDTDIPFTETVNLEICVFLLWSDSESTAEAAVVIMYLVPFYSSGINRCPVYNSRTPDERVRALSSLFLLLFLFLFSFFF